MTNGRFGNNVRVSSDGRSLSEDSCQNMPKKGRKTVRKNFARILQRCGELIPRAFKSKSNHQIIGAKGQLKMFFSIGILFFPNVS